MEEATPCPYCENFEGSCFTAQGTVQVFQFCPICGRPYSRNGKKPQFETDVYRDRPLGAP